MSAYVVMDVSVHDPELIKESHKLTPAAVAAFNGKFVIRGEQITTLEGDWKPERMVVIEFPTFEKANTWWNSEIYSEAKVIRQRATTTKMIIVEGL